MAHLPPTKRHPLPPAPKPVLPPKQPEAVVHVSLEDAKMWAKFSSGATRVAIWTDVVRRMEKIEATGREAVCKWWRASSRRHPMCPTHGATEVYAVELPRVSIRKRGAA